MDPSKIQLFISYGHERRNSRIVQKLVEALQKDFDLWIDRVNIAATNDWRREIVKGIRETSLTIGLLSEYSTRYRGVCLDELGISISIPGRKLITVLLENQKKVNLPSTVTRTQWIDFSQWKTFIDTAQWEDYFNPKMELLINSIKSRENYNFQGEITTLYKILKPEPFDSKVSLYINNSHSIPRPWLIERVNQWISGASGSRFLLLTGDAGTGKSHFSAMFQHYNPSCVAGAFFEHGKLNPHYVRDLVRYLAYILATKFPDYRYQLLNLFRMEGLISESDAVQDGKCAEFFMNHTAEALFDRLLCFQTLGGTNTNLAIILDGLDEVSEGDQNPLLDFLCSDLINKMPPYLKFVVTCRAEPLIMAKISKIRPAVMDLNSPDSDLDIESYIRNRISAMNLSIPVTETDIASIRTRCSQMFLYAELLCDALAERHLTVQNILSMPDGISGLYCSYFDRLFPSAEDYEHVKGYLRIICAFDVGNLSEDYLIRVTHTNREDLNLFIQRLRTFARSSVMDGKAYIFLFHKSLYDWLSDRELSGKYFIDISLGRKEILRSCSEIIKAADQYASYELLKNTYLFVSRHGDAEKLSLTPDFLYALQLSSYDNSDIEIFKTVTEKLETLTTVTGNTRLYILSMLCLLGWYYDVSCEQEKAYQLLTQLCTDYQDIISQDPELFTSVEINRIYIVNSYKKQYEEAWAWADHLIRYIQACTDTALPSKGIKLAKAYYHRCIIEFRMKKYRESIKTADYAVAAAEYGYADPRKLKCLIYIIQGGAFRELGEYDKSIDVLEKSLSYRLALYSRFSLFVANSYHNLIDTLYSKAVHTDGVLGNRILDYLEEYRKIILVTVGNHHPRMIPYYSYMARISERNREFAKAADFAEKCLQIQNPASFSGQEKEMLRIIQSCSGTSPE